MSDNDIGIHVPAGGNLIVRNSATENTNNFTIGAGNRYGPIVDVTVNNAPAPATSNSGTSTLSDANGGSHPWANFAY